MKPDATSAQVRATLERLQANDPHRASFAALSRMVGRHVGYLGRFVRAGVPARLDDRERKVPAGYFRVDERELGKLA